ncbi:ABC transporter ATP-binding protein [Catenulispora subtropica]|uniref:ABC transporter ATP-binding protein n=1 Tax=Catenulispora subtropica TaxID=450798 RepID=A0ABN2SRL8_9ACTN
MSGRESVIELHGLCREYPATPPVRALRDVDLTVRRGDHLAVVGPSGSGKSTLLAVLGLLDRPTSGSYALDGVETTVLGDGQRTVLRGRRIGFVFQSFHLLSHRSARENVELAEIHGGSSIGSDGGSSGRRGRSRRALAALDRVGLSHRADFLPNRLSGGERQRVAVARALMGDPALLLCDEPTGNLDSANTETLLDLFDELRAQGVTLLVITHDDAVSRRAARRVRIADGVLTEETVEVAL